jgi:hypothetical protein
VTRDIVVIGASARATLEASMTHPADEVEVPVGEGGEP